MEKVLKSQDLSSLELGKHQLSEEVFVISEKVASKSVEEAVLEAHREYIDVQLCLNNTDHMGWAPLDHCDDIKMPYDAERDLIFYHNAIQNQIAVGKKNFVIFFPWDAHAPNIGEGEFHKIIFKVKV